MSNWPYFPQATEEVLGVSGSAGVVLSTTSANSYGAWTDIGTLTLDADCLVVLMSGGGTSNAGTLFELALDASGVTRIASNVYIGRMTYGNAACITLPLHVSAGATIHGRAMSSLSSSGNIISIRALRGGWLNPSGWARCESLSGSPASANVPGMDCGLTGTWTELVSSTTRAYGGMAAVCGVGGTTGSRTSQPVVGQVGVGAVASEIVIADQILFRSGDSRVGPIGHIPLPSPIPAGVRVAVRATAGNAANGFSMDVIGFY